MTADIRTAAQREAERLMPIVGHDPMDFARSVAHDSFVKGAVWAAARVTPTREQIELAILGRTSTQGAKAVLALMQELAQEI